MPSLNSGFCTAGSKGYLQPKLLQGKLLYVSALVQPKTTSKSRSRKLMLSGLLEEAGSVDLFIYLFGTAA
jgi:hypothetical protein